MKEVDTIKAHISLNVKDIENSIKFYQKFFGIEPAKVRKGYAKFDVQNPPLNLALNEFPYKERGALSHLGIQVASTEDVLATKSRWEEVGLLTRDEMQTSCCYALQDKTWVRDPDGNQWEVFVILQDNLIKSDLCECGEQVVEEGLEGKITESCCGSESIPFSINRVSETTCC